MYGAFWADWFAGSGLNTIRQFLNPSDTNIANPVAIRGIYLREIANRRVPNVTPIMPLFKAPRPRLATLPSSGMGPKDFGLQEDDAELIVAGGAWESDFTEVIKVTSDVLHDLSEGEEIDDTMPEDGDTAHIIHPAPPGTFPEMERLVHQAMEGQHQEQKDASNGEQGNSIPASLSSKMRMDIPPFVVRNVPIDMVDGLK